MCKWEALSWHTLHFHCYWPSAKSFYLKPSTAFIFHISFVLRISELNYNCCLQPSSIHGDLLSINLNTAFLPPSDVLCIVLKDGLWGLCFLTTVSALQCLHFFSLDFIPYPVPLVLWLLSLAYSSNSSVCHLILFYPLCPLCTYTQFKSMVSITAGICPGLLCLSHTFMFLW